MWKIEERSRWVWGGARSKVTRRSAKPVATRSWQRIMEPDQAVHLNPYMCPKNFRGITCVVMFFHTTKGLLGS